MIEKDTENSRKRAAMVGLYETHFERVTRYVAVRIGNLSEAEDLASEVFMRALRSVDSYKDTGAPMEAWIFRIAHNLVANHLRDKSRRPALVPIDDCSQAKSHDDPYENAERQEEIKRLHRSMTQLSESQRQVLALRFGAGMTSDEVARTMGKNAGAVREMQSAAIKKLRKILGQMPGGDDKTVFPLPHNQRHPGDDQRA